MTPAGHGAAWLDEQRPGWAERVDTDTLNMSDGACCVFGQLDGSAAAGADAVAWWYNDGWAWMHEHGFYISGGNQEDYDRLTDEWRGLIRERARQVYRYG